MAKYLALLILSLFVVSCDKNSAGSGTMPLVTPPVRAATPAGFTARGVAGRALSSSDFRSRFFSAGPTNIFGILTDIDSRITGINSRTTPTTACSSTTPVAYTINPWGQTVTMYAQCYENVGTGLIQWGVKDRVTYLYVAIGATRSAIQITPHATLPDKYQVKAWISLGFTNTTCGTAGTWDGCSYGVMEIAADNSVNTFDFSVAGMGFGYCGAQLKSDGTNVYSKGSADGVGGACNAVDTLCVLASDITTPGTCASTTFTVSELGRKAVASSPTTVLAGAMHQASTHPAVPNVTLNGTSTDDINFGPTTPTAGVTAF